MALVEGRYFKGDMTDKRFEADGLAAYCRRLFSSGVWELGNNLKVSPSEGMRVNIGYGYALINGYLYGVVDNGTGPLQLTVENADSQPRIDRVVGIADANAQRIYVCIKKGTPASSPVTPSLVSGEISLARISVAANSTVITAANITDERADDTFCGLVKQTRYDIGDVYISSKPTSPATKFGGIWTRIKDVFPLFAGDTFAAGNTGGSRYMQSHSHTINHDHGAINSDTVSNDHAHYVSGQTGGQSADHAHWVTNEDGTYIGQTGGVMGSFGINRSSTGRATTFKTGGTHNDHSHGFGAWSGGINANHTHRVDLPNFTGSSGSAGSGNGDNMPPYKAFYAWERTA